MAEIRALGFRLNDAPKMLSSAEEIESAIARGQIAADTEVTLYLDDGTKRFAAAHKHVQLRDYFSVPEPPPAPAAPIVAGVPVADETEAVDDATAPAEPPPEFDDEDEDDGDDSGDPVPPREEEEDYRSTSARQSPRPDPGNTRKYVLFGVAVVVAILLIRQCDGDTSSDEPATAASEPVAAPTTADVATPAPPAEVVDSSSAGEFRLLRESPLLASPNGAAGPTLRTGAKVFVAGTVDGFAKVSDEEGRSGYMNWNDINGNPYLTERYRLNFNNRCNVPKTFLLIWHQNGTWYTSENQIPTVGAGEYTNLYNTVDGVRSEIVLDRLELYYRPLPRGPGGYSEIRPSSERTVVIDGTEEKMLAAIPEVTDSGNVIVTFDGSAC